MAVIAFPVLPDPELVLFDLDGTLVDSIPDLTSAVDAMLVALGFEPAGQEPVSHWVGNGAPKLVERALRAKSAEALTDGLLAKANQLFNTHYEHHNGEQACVYKGVLAFLQSLHQQNISMGIVTNKPSQFTEQLLERLNLTHFFNLVLSGDSLPEKKPSPAPLLHAMDFFAKRPQETLMVGDSINDVKAARSANVSVVAVSYGYNHGEQIDTANPDIVVDSLAELLC
ncbi:phosphoglycolate phosphatase [Zooshikella sp. RANM57]|uniref:phosphoglycolate phosphatase n=1 Tax=Zooshikella sp. RANM57 TaxID=3425863 RepID=UPI003D6E4365